MVDDWVGLQGCGSDCVGFCYGCDGFGGFVGVCVEFDVYVDFDFDIKFYVGVDVDFDIVVFSG